MEKKEVRVGVSGLCKYPESTWESVEKMASWAREVGGEFLVYAVGWGDKFRQYESYPGREELAVPVMGIENTWWEDRMVELKTPLPTLGVTWRKVAGTLAMPGRGAVGKVLDVYEDAYLVRRWPVLSDEMLDELGERRDLLARRNEELGKFPRHTREILDVHSTNLGLTPGEILEWKREGGERRLMSTWPDERLPAHGLGRRGQDYLLRPLMGEVSAVSIKVADVYDLGDKLRMTRGEVAQSIVDGRKNTDYAWGIRNLVGQLGEGRPGVYDVIVKVKGSVDVEVGGKIVTRDEFVRRTVEYVREVVG
jgi:hypothetical protein